MKIAVVNQEDSKVGHIYLQSEIMEILMRQTMAGDLSMLWTDSQQGAKWKVVEKPLSLNASSTRTNQIHILRRVSVNARSPGKPSHLSKWGHENFCVTFVETVGRRPTIINKPLLVHCFHAFCSKKIHTQRTISWAHMLIVNGIFSMLINGICNSMMAGILYDKQDASAFVGFFILIPFRSWSLPLMSRWPFFFCHQYSKGLQSAL